MFFRLKRRSNVTDMDSIRSLLEAAPIKMGDAPRGIIIFFDLACPFCAKMFKESEEYLLELARAGKITVAFCDFIVHREAEGLHKYLRCLSTVEERLRFMGEVYSGKAAGVGDCDPHGLKRCDELAYKLGVRGTPAVLGFNFERRRALLSSGYMTLTDLMEFIDSL